MRRAVVIVAAAPAGDAGFACTATLEAAPFRYSVPGAGKVDARTTKLGKVRVVLEANDREQLAKLWNSLKKKLM